MPTTRRIVTLVFAVALAGLTGCGNGEPTKPGTRTIAVIPKGTTHEFWKSIHAGAEKARHELAQRGTPIELIWKGPQKEDDREQQIRIVEDIVNGGVSGIVLAPLDDKALVRPVREAVGSNVPVVIIDSGLATDAIVSFVATDNYKGGALAAERLGALLNGKGRAMMLRYQEGSDSTMQRERGFTETLAKDFPGIELVSSNQYGGATTETSYQKSEALLTSFPDVDGVFCPNESTTFGMLRALQDAGRAGTCFFVGFDASPKLVASLRKREIHGLVLQNPFRMGFEGVMTLVAHLDGTTCDKRIDTGVALVTPDNIDDEAMKALHSPDLDRWLK